MSIVTRTGDAGTTALMYGRRVSKCDPRVEAYGTVDELNAALGLAVASVRPASLGRALRPVQQDLIALMGELATHPRDLPRYVRAGYPRIAAEHTARLERLVRTTESGLGPLTGWALPGASASSASLDLARAICRRAERRVCALHRRGGLHNPEVIIFLNRLSDLLWLLARREEAASCKPQVRSRMRGSGPARGSGTTGARKRSR
jgi:cob(I)alamin adenosyltransferase